MNTSTSSTVSPQEIERRVREYRDKSRQQQVMPHIIYRPPFVVCPWPNCSHKIAGVDFQLELIGEAALYQQLLDAWWKGPGLVGRCPNCKNHVLFAMQDKRQVADPSAFGGAVLPDDWHQHAYFLG